MEQSIKSKAKEKLTKSIHKMLCYEDLSDDKQQKISLEIETLDVNKLRELNDLCLNLKARNKNIYLYDVLYDSPAIEF